MANAKEKEDLAVLKSQMIDVRAELVNMRKDQNDNFKALSDQINNLDNKYPTRREVMVIKWILGLLVAVASVLAVLYAGNIK